MLVCTDWCVCGLIGGYKGGSDLDYPTLESLIVDLLHNDKLLQQLCHHDNSSSLQHTLKVTFKEFATYTIVCCITLIFN